MELLAPAGNIDKLYYAYRYGADAAYIGLQNYSLRAKADNFTSEDCTAIDKLKGDKKLYGALNIFFHDEDILSLEQSMDILARFPFDAFILSDIGILPLVKKYFPDRELHLSTQANCTNTEAARMYRDMGFSRIIPAREMSLKNIEQIKSRIPDLEIEVFIHGAMCLAYSGRCMLSAYLSGRSGNKGDCAHSCRWNYRELVLEEQERPGEYLPVVKGENFTTILSSRDLCMIDHLKDLRDAGVDALKIEGRMKSVYYTAVTTRAYRKALDHLKGADVPAVEEFKAELNNVSHREYSTGFFFGNELMETPADTSYLREYLFLGTIEGIAEDGLYEVAVKNRFDTDTQIEYIGPDVVSLNDTSFRLYNERREKVQWLNHGTGFYLQTDQPLQKGYIIRKPI